MLGSLADFSTPKQIFKKCQLGVTAFRGHPVDFLALHCIIKQSPCCLPTVQSAWEKVGMLWKWRNSPDKFMRVIQYMCRFSSMSQSYLGRLVQSFMSRCRYTYRHGEATWGFKAATRKTMSDQSGAAESKQRLGWVKLYYWNTIQL